MQAQGLECTVGHKTARDTGTFSYACHAVEAEVDAALEMLERMCRRLRPSQAQAAAK